MQSKTDADNWTPEFQATATAPETRENLVRWVGGLRDGLIVLATVVYVLGYACWAVHARLNELGPIPALDAQYFIAGAFPALVITISYLGIRLILWIARGRTRKLSPLQEKAGKVLGFIGMGLMFAGVLTNYLLREGESRIYQYFTYAAAAFIYAAAFFSRKTPERIMQRLALGILWMFLFMGGVYFLGQYVVNWFPQVPQEFGGPSPRMVELDLKTEVLSRATADQLLPDGQPAELKGTRRSRPVYLLFDGGDLVLVKRDPGPVSADNPVHRLRKSAVLGVFPRDRASQ
jgi:hypothetical protein